MIPMKRINNDKEARASTEREMMLVLATVQVAILGLLSQFAPTFAVLTVALVLAVSNIVAIRREKIRQGHRKTELRVEGMIEEKLSNEQKVYEGVNNE